MQEPFQPLQPLEAPPAETFAVQHVEPVQLQQVEPLQPLAPLPALEPLQPTMPPPLPLLTVADHAAEAVPAAPAGPAPNPEEVANLGVPLGTLIFRAGLLTEEQLEEALQEGVRSGKRLGEVLLESGLLDERDLGRLLADQKGLRFVELSSLTADPTATALLSPEKAHMYAALPVGFEGGVPLVAVADPSNELVTENLRRALGSEPRLLVASRSDLHATIDRVHAVVTEEPVVEAEAPAAEEAPVPSPVEVAQPVEPPALPRRRSRLRPSPRRIPSLRSRWRSVRSRRSSPSSSRSSPTRPEPEPEPAAEVEPEAVPVLQPVEVEHVTPPQPETNGYSTVAPLVPEAPEPTPAPVVPEPEPVALEPVLLEAPAPEPTYSRVEEEEASAAGRVRPGAPVGAVVRGLPPPDGRGARGRRLVQRSPEGARVRPRGREAPLGRHGRLAVLQRPLHAPGHDRVGRHRPGRGARPLARLVDPLELGFAAQPLAVSGCCNRLLHAST